MTLAINDPNHPLTKISRLSTPEELREINVAFSLVRKQKEADRYYRAKSLTLSESLNTWLKQQILRETRSLQIADSDGIRRFVVGEYHLEVQKQDQLARLTLDETIGIPYERKKRLLQALAHPDRLLETSNTEFQVVQLEVDGHRLYFFFYRKPKQSASRKKWAFGRSNELTEASEELIELGGKIEFVLFENELYISKLQSFEYVFDYRDHIVQARDHNLAKLTDMPFFAIAKADKERFKRDCAAFFHTRTVAQMSRKQMEALEQNFKDRCSELRTIRNAIPATADREREYRQAYAPLWELYEFLDLENEQVVYPEGSRPTVLLRFFGNKIVQSFLTKEFGLTDSIDSAEQRADMGV
ncbi:Kiwa anti-phage protein KwaB-like domain-containing protein [Saccharibacillus sacchari]|uniref:Kiwa anti-phage protein KwaB-like domain-containing protein n=1 Tax=Saccharibacillus sacchari TaxID=456493 RepID=A0ACC6PC05_9BACL